MNIYDLVIIGSGPSRIAAAVYAQRACLTTVIIEKTGMSGGQILTTTEVDNYPGLPGIGGFDLGMKMREHVDHLSGQFMTGEVVKITNFPDHKVIAMADGTSTLNTRAIIIATGASHRHLNIPRKKKPVSEPASLLRNLRRSIFQEPYNRCYRRRRCGGGGRHFPRPPVQKVYVVHRRDSFRAGPRPF